MPRRKIVKYNQYKLNPRCFSFNFLDDPTKFKHELEEIIGNKKVFVELCAGYGEYSIQFAKYNPDWIVIASDIKEDRLIIPTRVAQRELLNNFFTLRMDANIFDLVFEDVFDVIYLIHPDPQPNKKRKRLNQPKFISQINKGLKENGVFRLVTDNLDFFQEFEANLELQKYNYLSNDAFQVIPTRYNLKFVTDNNLSKTLTFNKQKQKN
ncbi:MAG: hypothetical protein ACRCXZ_01055 [Patescibacteria group bacterium]